MSSHSEAFCLMKYRCEKCEHTETFWNARDGVTPFGVGCPLCDGHMLHILWRADKHEPKHLPTTGQGVFITTPPELRVVFARRRVESFNGTEFELQGLEKEQMITTLARSFQEDEPLLIRWSW